MAGPLSAQQIRSRTKIMRIVGLEISAVGGLADGYVELPEGPIAALAGANGTGKSKLLACILSPWTSTIPSATEGRIGRVKVDIELTETESVIIEELCRQIGWGNDAVPSTISIITENSALNGQQRTAIPASPFGLGHIWQHGPAMRAAPSLSVVYLPAERRLLPPVTSGIDLNQLTEDLAWQAGTQSRSAVSNYGRLDDQEFEQYAKALCVAAVLPREPGDSLPAADNKARWEEFESTVNSIIDPKKLLGLTSSHPDTLRILTPSGAIHGVQDLSSGERQALIIMSRVLRAGDLHPIIMIDEPDAYLHPNLSKRLIRALGEGVGPSGQLIFATHSPAILDELHVSSILRLEHSSPARAVQSEDERLDVYRRAGFRASALTQSELLVITEGDFDAAVLGHLLPELSGASLRPAGGKKRFFKLWMS